MKPKLVYIEWLDAFTEAGWYKPEEIKALTGEECLTKHVGWIVDEDKRRIVLGSCQMTESEFFQQKWADIHIIPKTWIRKRRVLKVP